MRTSRRGAETPTADECAGLEEHFQAFAGEKQYWICELTKKSNRHLIKQHRKVRDEAVQSGYTSRFGLQARIWKLALIEAAETLDKHYQAHFVGLRSRVARQGWSEEKRHYAFWVLSRYETYFYVLEGKVPRPQFQIPFAERAGAANWLRRTSRKTIGSHPRVRLQRSLALDADCYKITTDKDGNQYAEIMTLERGKRLKLPLNGIQAVSGNVRLVRSGKSIALHASTPVKARTSAIKPSAASASAMGTGEAAPIPVAAPVVIATAPAGRLNTKSRMMDDEVEALKYTKAAQAIDFGYTEAFTDTSGRQYGQGLGTLIAEASDKRDEKGAKRNKLRALKEKYEQSNSPKLKARARRMARHNLGDVKWEASERRAKATIERKINESLNQLYISMNMSGHKTLVVEDLRHSFSYNSSRSMNRRLSSWSRGVLQDRALFKAGTFGVAVEAVNPAYGSQECYRCGFVDSKNRKGDLFTCQHCGVADQSDRVAAINLLRRMDDPAITVNTPYTVVKDVLLKRHAHLETEDRTSPEVTVQGRTSDTAPGPTYLAERKHSGKTPPAVNRRAKQKSMVKEHEYK